MTFQNIVKNALNTIQQGRRRTQRNQISEARVEPLESRALLTLIGAEVTVIASAQDGSPIGSPGFAVVESRTEAELPQFAGQYDINLTGNSISLINNLSGNATTSVGSFDFQFNNLAPNEGISAAVADSGQRLVPNVEVLPNNAVRVTITAAMQTGQGFDALINLSVTEISVPMIGRDVSVHGTTQSNLGTGGVEIPSNAAVTATIADGANDPEFTSFANIYDIDVDAQTIAMNFNLAAGATDPSRVIEAETFERYYFQLDLADSEFISSASADPGATLVPNVSVLGTDMIVVEVGPGMQIGDGFNALINLNVEVAGAQVSGRIWQDLNNNGTQDSNEGWLNGFDVTLNDEGDNEIARTYSRNIDLNNDGVIDQATEAGIYLFEGVQNGRLTVEQDVPGLWYQTSPPEASAQALIDLRDSLGLRAGQNEFLNYGGLNEKWIQGDNATWFYVTADGAFYQWDGMSPRTALVSTFIQNVGPAAYDDLSLLYNAAPQMDLVINVESSAPITSLDFGNFLPPPNTFYINPNNTDNSVFFEWHPGEIPHGATVEIWIANVSTRRRFEVSGGHSDSYTSRGPDGTGFPEGRYRAWARIEVSPGLYSGWTSGQEFEFTHPAIQDLFTTGLDAGIDATPTVHWTAVPGAVSYDIVVNSGAYKAFGVIGNSHRVEKPLSLAEHSISIRINYADGSRTAWSNGQALTVAGQPVTTVSGDVVSWTSVSAATQYELWVDRIDNSGNRIDRQAVFVTDIKDLSYTLADIPNGRYSVWVRAIRAENELRHSSLWSDRIDFQVTSIESQLRSSNQLTSLEPILTALPTQLQESTPEKSPVAPKQELTEERNSVEQGAATSNGQELPLVHEVMAELSSSEMLDDVQA